MSAVANFRLIEKSKLKELTNAAEVTIKKGFLFKKVIDNYYQYLDANTKMIVDFEESGYIFGNLLVYLEEKKNIDLLKSEYDDIASDISNKRKNTIFLLTKNHKDRYEDLLIPENFPLEELIGFNIEFSDDNDPDFAQAELKGIAALRASLGVIPDENFVVILSVE